MRDRRLQGVKTIVERQQGMLPKRDDDRFFLDRKHRRTRLFRPRAPISDRVAAFPLGDGLRIGSEAIGQRSQALLTAVSLDGPPLLSWRSREEPGP